MSVHQFVAIISYLVTAIKNLTGPNMLTALLEYINLFNLPQWRYKANIREKLPILGLTLPYTVFKPN